MAVRTVPTTPFEDQRPGTSGLRKKTRHFMREHYLENFVQAVFDVLREDLPEGFSGKTLVLGGDGRYYNREAVGTILRMAAANGFGRVLVGRGGILSTPAVSAVIRGRKAFGGFILSASHNPGGPDGDFGIKYNMENGGPATADLTERIFVRTKALREYKIADVAELDIDAPGERDCRGMRIDVIDPVADYAACLEGIFDFDRIAGLLAGDFSMVFDGMNAVTGPYAKYLFEERLKGRAGLVVRGTPLEDFGGIHPDPNLIYAKDLVDRMYDRHAPDFGAASDGDGDRNLIAGRDCFVSPGDSLAVITEHAAACIPGYHKGLSGVARSMPTSTAVDRVAEALGIPVYETPTGWKFFGSLMDAGLCTVCGEESFGTGSAHIREKDGLWAVMAWLSILAGTGKSVAELLQAHWARFGRSYFQRHDFEGLDATAAAEMLEDLRGRLGSLVGRTLAAERVQVADDFSYTDPVTGQTTGSQGIRLIEEGGSRVVCRLSGTGTEGATLRLYIERYLRDGGKQEPGAVLVPLLGAARDLLKLKHYCGRDQADVIT